MNRRKFLGLLAAIPLVGYLIPRSKAAEPSLPVVKFNSQYIVNEEELFAGVPWTQMKFLHPPARFDAERGIAIVGWVKAYDLPLGADEAYRSDIERTTRCWLPEEHKVYDYNGENGLYYWGEVELHQHNHGNHYYKYGQFRRTERSQTLKVKAVTSSGYLFPREEVEEEEE